MKSSLKWQRATTIFPTDHIISSKARELNTLYGFKPQYENVKRPNLNFLLSNEYMRLWFKERELYQKENYAKQEMAKNDVNLKRAYVQRMMKNSKLESRELPIIQLKRFQNIISKVDNRNSVDEKTKICERFKKSYEPVVLTRYKPVCSQQHKTTTLEQKLQPTQKRTSSNGKQLGKDNVTEENSTNCPLICKLV